MARNRIVKKEIYTDQKIIELEIFERFMFIGMTNFSDDEGIHINSAKMLKCEIFPADDIKVSVIEKSLLKMENLGLIEYDKNRELIRICNFLQHQTINRPYPSKYNFVEGESERSMNTHTPLTPNNNNKDNNNNKKNSNIETRKQKFTNQVLAEGIKQKPVLDPSICDEFIEYWTEPNRTNTKMKFELEKTFEVGRRLKRWVRNDYTVAKKETEVLSWKKDTTGKFILGYCVCGKSDFYEPFNINKQDTKCCHKKILPTRGKIENVDARA